MRDSVGQQPVGIVGLGAMGGAAVEQLALRGMTVRCYDTAGDRLREMARLDGVTVCGSALDVASGCAVVLTFLPTSAAVRAVATEVLPGMAPGSYLLDMSTCEPELAAEIDGPFRASGRRFVDCPVSRKAPNSSIFVGGLREDLDEIAALLQLLGTEIVYGGRIGAGYLMKALHQYVKYARFDAALRALLFGEAQGLDVELTARALLSGTAGDAGLGTAEYATGVAADGRTHAPARIIAKDIAIAVEMFAKAGRVDTTAAEMGEFWADGCAAGYADRPYTSIVHYARERWAALGHPNPQ